MQRIYFLPFIIALLVAATGHAATPDSLAAAEHTLLLPQKAVGVSGNPALMHDRYATSFSELAADYAYERGNEPFLYQTGSGENFARLEATSYLRLSPTTTVWGEASYRTGRRHAVKWCSTADYMLLYPYVMADTLGGALTSERYTFRAGWASRLGRVTMGAAADFRAEHEYRTYDPRPRCIVTQLAVTLGAAYHFKTYRLAADVGGNFYKQTNSVKFFREAGTIPEYQMTGLATDYRRFSTDNPSIYYKATGLTLGLDLMPEHTAGAYASFSYDYTPYRRILPNQNALPLTTLYVQQWKGRAGWRGSIARWRIDAAAGTAYERRTGDEHITGSASSSEYRTLTDLTMYHAHCADIYALLSAARDISRATLSLRLQGGAHDFRARYVTPERHMAWREAYLTLDAQWQQRLGSRRLLTCAIEATAALNTQSSLSMPFATMNAVTTDLVDHTYDNLTADRCGAALDVRYDFPLVRDKSYAFFVSARGAYTAAGHWHETQAALAVGMTF